MSPTPQTGNSRWSIFADAALNAATRFWFVLAGMLAATMGMWPPHLYI